MTRTVRFRNSEDQGWTGGNEGLELNGRSSRRDSRNALEVKVTPHCERT